jgi:hypothetical protein
MRLLRILLLVGLVLPCIVTCGNGRTIDASSVSDRVTDEVRGEAVHGAPTAGSVDGAAGSTAGTATATVLPTEALTTEGPIAVSSEETVAPENTTLARNSPKDSEIYSFDPGLWVQNISALNSFRQKAVLDFTVEGSGNHSRVTYEGEVTTSPLAMHSLLRVEGQAAAQLPSNKIEAIWLGEAVWVKVGRGPWVQVSTVAIESEFEGQVMSVGDLLPYVQQARRVTPDETVNGIPCRHYVYDLENLQTDAGMTSAKGDIWVAKKDGQVVRLTMDGQGVYYAIYRSSGTLSLVYDLFDVNAPISIEPPR